MTDRCDYLISRFDIVGIDEFSAVDEEVWYPQCLRPEGHAGAHLIQQVTRIGGSFIAWKDDSCEFGTCDDCDSEDPEDNCCAYWKVSKDEADKLILLKNYEGEE